MGAAASAASPPPEAAAPAASPPPKASAPADLQAKEDIQHGAAADPPSEAAAPADSPAKEVIQSAAPADSPAKEVIQSAAPADSPAKEEIQSPAPADAPGGDAEAAGETVVLDASAAESGGQEEQGECGFCLYMKGGGCREEFVEWEKCIAVAETEGGDIVERCSKETTALRLCMDKYPDYYEVILSAERAMSEDLEAAVKAEAEGKADQDSPASPPALAAEGEQGDNKKQPEEDVVVVVEETEDPAEETVVVVVEEKEDPAEEAVVVKEKKILRLDDTTP